jgi:hypothetical protein
MATKDFPTPHTGNIRHLTSSIEKNEYEAGKIRVEITPTIARDLVARDKFIMLGHKHASKVRSNGTSEHWISTEIAKELHDDAKVRRAERDIPKGTARAYSCLLSNLDREIQRVERRGLFDDPGYDEAVNRMNSELCKLPLGSAALTCDGTPVEIYKPFGIYCVSDPAARFVQRDGARVDYKPGYIVKEAGGKPFFISPCDLTTIDGNCPYLRSVPVNPSQRTVA